MPTRPWDPEPEPVDAHPIAVVAGRAPGAPTTMAPTASTASSVGAIVPPEGAIAEWIATVAKAASPVMASEYPVALGSRIEHPPARAKTIIRPRWQDLMDVPPQSIRVDRPDRCRSIDRN